MAVYHLSARAISRGDGRSAVAAAAYRRGARMENRQEDHVSDYSRKERVAHSEITLPDHSPEWVRDLASLPGNEASEEIWNTYEEFETRKNALLAREAILALPKELSLGQNIELVREFTQSQFAAHGVVTDWSIHNEDGNPHAHVMILPRHVVHDGFGPKSEPIRNGDGEIILRPNGQPMYKPVVGSRDDLNRWRESWAAIQNEHLARYGHEVRVDHRSYRDQGIGLKPTRHVGPAGMGMARRGLGADRFSEHQKTLIENGRRILERPELIIQKVAAGRSVFTESDLIKEAGVYLNSAEEVEVFRQRVLASPELVQLAKEVRHETKDWVLSAARFTSREMLSIETEMAGLASKMAATQGHSITLDQGKAALSAYSYLGHEQQIAVEHVLINKQLASVVGYAGTGKTTMVEAAKHAWEAAGYSVKGGALSGIAAQGLGDGAGIESRTLASWEYAWERGRDLLTNKDILVVDEAGMVGSRQMRDVLVRANDAGAKVVLIGDAEQLQPIEAGAAFRAISEQSGAAVIGEIRRQKEEWMRDASKAFATHDTAFGFEAYRERGRVIHEADAATAKSRLVSDWIEGTGQKGSQIVLAHRRIDVADLNLAIREKRIEEGALSSGQVVEVAGGAREFAPGEQIIFQNNDRTLGVKNGMLGRVEKAGANSVDVRLGSEGAPGRLLQVDLKAYNHLDYGYAATIHKSQGVTVDRAFVYGSRSMDRHLTYVAMTRHRDDVKFYSSSDEFKDPGRIGAHLARARLQSTTLDYLERRQAVPEQDRAAYLRWLYERQVERLKLVTQRLAEVPTRLKQRFGIDAAVPIVTKGHEPGESLRPGQVEQTSSIRSGQEVAKPFIPSSTPAGLELSRQNRAFIPAISADQAAGIRSEYLSHRALDAHVANDPVVLGAVERLQRVSKFVSPEFQRQVSSLSIDQIEQGGISDLVQKHRLSKQDIVKLERDVTDIRDKVKASRVQCVDRVEKAILRAGREVPSLSPEAQEYADRLHNFKDPAAAKKFVENHPNAEKLSDEIKGFERALNKRFGVSSVREVGGLRELDLQIAGRSSDQILEKAKPAMQLREGLSRVQTLTRSLGINLGFSR